jgi:hypothetical protein
VRLDQGKRCQGLEEEEEEEKEEEEEGAYGSTSPTPWVDLVDEEDLAYGNASLGGLSSFLIKEHAPPEPTEVGHSAPYESSEQRKGSKRPCTDEA